MYIRTSTRPSEKRNRMILIISGGVVAIVTILQFFLPHLLPSIFTTIVRPFWRIEFAINSGSLRSPEYLLAENESLKIQLQTVMADDASVDLIKSQNAELLSILGRSDVANSISSTTIPNIIPSATLTHQSRILAAVLVRPPLSPYDELIIDVGSDKAITVGSKVYAPGNILIGTVSDVLGQTSKVSLYSSPGMTYSVLLGPNHISATAIGRGGGQYEAQLPQATQIAQGDIVSDSTIGDGMFGTVTSVLNNPSDPFETVLFAPVLNIYSLRWVLIDNSQTESGYVNSISNQNSSQKVNTTPATTTHATTSSTKASVKTKK